MLDRVHRPAAHATPRARPTPVPAPTSAWLAALLLLGCGSAAPAPRSPDAADTGAEVAGDGASRGAPTDAAAVKGDADALAPAQPWDLPAVPYTLQPGEPIAAPLETWSFVPTPGAKCANGSATGMAVNLTQRSSRLVFYLQGGGACWEAAACAAGTATHVLDTMDAKAVLAEAQAAPMQVLFNRNDQNNPFRDASFVYVPYCTADLHAGTAPFTYDWFGPKVVHHVGARNVDAYLARLAPTFAKADRVWLMGISAGGYGATLNWWRVQKAMPWARVDVVNDSGLMLDPAPDGRWPLMRERWQMEFFPGCKACKDHLSASLTEQAVLLASPRRLALLGYLQDQTIGLYFGLAGPVIEQGLNALRQQLPAHAATYYLAGNQHVLLSTPKAATSKGIGVLQWLQDFAADAAWVPAGP